MELLLNEGAGSEEVQKRKCWVAEHAGKQKIFAAEEDAECGCAVLGQEARFE